MTEESLVSTIIPVFNRPVMLREAVASVLAQTHRAVEIILVDDGSTDDTPRVADELAVLHAGRVRVIHQENSGPGSAREAGRRIASGAFIQYLDSDDWLHPRKFEAQVELLRSTSDAGVAYCKTWETRIGEPRTDVPSLRTGARLNTLFPDLLSSRCWQTVTPLLRRSLSDRIGPWTSLRQEEDLEYDARIAGLGTRLVWRDEFLAEHRHHSGDRAGGNSLDSPEKMKDRATAHRLIYEHSMRAGIAVDDPHMRHFARELFLLSRQCGSVGLSGESRDLFDLARAASGQERSKGLDFRLYRAVAAVGGWATAGKLASVADRLRRAP